MKKLLFRTVRPLRLHRIKFGILAVLVSRTLAGIAGGPAVTLNTAFHPKITQTGWVDTAAQAADGKLLVGGLFQEVNGVAHQSLARFNVDGSLDPAFQASVGPGDIVRSIAVQRNGKILIGGDISHVNGAYREGAARLNDDGTLDIRFAPAFASSGIDISALAVQADGKVLVGGYFPGVGRVTQPNLVRLNPDGSVDTGFDFALTGDGTVHALTVQPDGKILVEGRVIRQDGNDVEGLIRLNADGTKDAGFQPCVFDTGAYNVDLVLQPDGKIFLGGGFYLVNGLSRRSVVRLHADGTVDKDFNFPALTLASGGLTSPTTFAVQADGRLIIVTEEGLRRFNADGTADPSFDAGSFHGDIGRLLTASDGSLFAGGEFTRLGGASRDSLARLGPDGALDVGFQPIIGIDGSVEAFARRSNGQIVIGGNFHRVDGVVHDNVARLNADGSLDGGFAPELMFNGSIRAVALQSDGRVTLGGLFTAVIGAETRYSLLRLQADGNLDGGFPSGLSSSGGSVSALQVLADDRVLVGGYFSRLGSVEVNGLARLNVDGNVDTDFHTPFGYNDMATSLLVQPDGKTLVGSNPYAGYTDQYSLVRLNVDGSLDAGFQPSLAKGSTVTALALQTDGKVLFHTSPAYGSNVPYDDAVLRVGSDGRRDTGFHTALKPYLPVMALALQGDGKVLVGAGPMASGGSGEPGLTRLSPDGSADAGYQPVFRQGDGTSSTVTAVAVQPDGQILAAGNFHGVDLVRQSGLALLPPATPVVASVLGADIPGAQEGGKVRALFARTGDVSGDLQVFYKVRGSGQAGLEGQPKGGSLLIPAGKRQAKLKLKTIDDAIHQELRRVVVELLPSPRGEYALGEKTRLKVTLLDND